MNAEKWHHSEIRIAINDESQGSIAKNLRCDELLYYTFIIHSTGENFFVRLVNIWRSYGQGSIAKNLRCDELLYYTFIIYSTGERIFVRLVNIWRSYGQNR